MLKGFFPVSISHNYFNIKTKDNVVQDSVPKHLAEWGGPQKLQPIRSLCKLQPHLGVYTRYGPQIRLGL